jgi:2,3-bisphosphoglycerate-dependent phosphoglycerate mutase
MSTIYLFRHGQTDFNLRKIFTGWLQSELTEVGIEQAKQMAELLKDTVINIAYTPNLTRCQKTLSEVLKYHPECTKTIIDDRILERNYGDVGGKLHQDIIDQLGQEQFDKWHRGWSDRPPAGESYADVEVRIKDFLDDLKQKYHDQQLNIAICGSSNSIRLTRKIMENATIADTVSWTIPYDSYFQYEI